MIDHNSIFYYSNKQSKIKPKLVTHLPTKNNNN